MTNTVAAWLAGLIVVGAIADQVLNGGQILFATGLKLADLLNWMAFWR